LNRLKNLKSKLIYTLKKKINVDEDFISYNASLSKLFRYYNSDKGSTYINDDNKFVSGNDYISFYEKHFSKFKNKKINILELGVNKGGSSASFINYFPHANIFCLEKDISNFSFTSKKIKIHHFKTFDQNEIQNFLKVNFDNESKIFDIIINNYFFKLSEQIKSLFLFFEFLKNKGTFVVEQFRFPNLYLKYNDADKESKMDEIFNYIDEKKIFKSNLIKKDKITYLLQNVKRISTYKGHYEYSDIAFVEKK